MYHTAHITSDAREYSLAGGGRVVLVNRLTHAAQLYEERPEGMTILATEPCQNAPAAALLALDWLLRRVGPCAICDHPAPTPDPTTRPICDACTAALLASPFGH